MNFELLRVLAPEFFPLYPWPGMRDERRTAIPSLVRIKPGALGRLGIYARRHGFLRVGLFFSADMAASLRQSASDALSAEGVSVAYEAAVEGASFEAAVGFFRNLPGRIDAIIGLGGGKALDSAKYVAFLAGISYVAVPTSLSNDGLCSPQASLTVEGRRKSLPSAMPGGLVIDTEICRGAPEILWLSGVGDLMAKFTAVADWKLAFHARGEALDDFAALLSDASVHQFLARPERSEEGLRLLGTALMLNGISMGICGSSRPASGSEHLISHALDGLSKRPRLHGLQVGVASYLVSLLQGRHAEVIARAFEETGFWRAIEDDPFDRGEWLEAVRQAPAIKADFYTVLSSRDCLPEVERALDEDPYLRRCFPA